VVERPASVLKELLENALDAGARHVEVDAEEGGVRLLRVRDDGHGIHREDLAIALARHATSKIRSFEDLLRVRSLGFRGEALPSIASVSRLTLASRAAGASAGWQVRVDAGGPVEGPRPVAQPYGTTVEVRDLFFSVPARRKFLRSELTERGHLEDVARRVALARFDVGLHLRHGGRDLLVLRPVADEAGRGRRVAAVCGAAFIERALAIESSREGLRLWGWIGLPEASRGHSDLQHFFLNGRPVRDRLPAHALREAYRDLIYPGRHPAYVLYLEVDPEQVDFNVHPTKQEVRFRDTRWVHDFLRRSVADALEGFAPGVAVPATAPAPQADGGRAPASVDVAEATSVYRALYAAPAVGPAADGPGATRVLGVAHGRYLLAEAPGGVLVADLRSARETLARRLLESDLAAGRPRSRPLLLPAEVRVGAERAQAAEDRRQCWEALGLEVTRSGLECVTVRRVPVVLTGVDPQALLESLLADLPGVARGRPCDPSTLLPVLARQAGLAPGATDREQVEGLLRGLERDAGRRGGPWRVLSLDELARLASTPAAPLAAPADAGEDADLP
jgi:DNA mismatch repair protein MutL